MNDMAESLTGGIPVTNTDRGAPMLRIAICCGGGFSSSTMAAHLNRQLEEKGLQDEVFLEFIPFDLSGERPEKIAYGHDLPTVMTSVPVTQHIEDGLGNIIQTSYLELRAGIVGLTQDVETMALRPEIGWLVKLQYNGMAIPQRDTTSANTIRADKPDETKVVVSGN